MIISNENYQIEITKDEQYKLFSVDNNFYNRVIKCEEYTRNDFVCAYSVSVQSLGVNYRVALIGRSYGYIENCAVLEGDRLVLLVDNYLVFFDLIAQRLEKKIKILEYGTGIKIYPFDDGYIVNGEIDIIKVDRLGGKMWDFSGSDIWVRANGESSITILGDNLLLKDWEGYNYYLDKSGKEISE